MEDVSCVLPRVTPDAWLSVLDVTAMYHHLHLATAARSLFGFAVETIDKRLEYYICITLPFGTGRDSILLFTANIHFCLPIDFFRLFVYDFLSDHSIIRSCWNPRHGRGTSLDRHPWFYPSCFCITGPATFIMDKLIAPIRRFCHLHGVDFSCFVDDSINVSLTKLKALACLKFIKFVFNAAGWELCISKTKGPANLILYLGFYISSTDMRISVPYMKIVILVND